MSPPPKNSSMFSDAFSTLVVRGIGILLMFASTTLTAKLLGPEEYGTYTAALSLALLLATLAPMGSDRLLVRNLSTVKCPADAGRETAIAHLCTAAVAAFLLSGCLVSWLMNALVLDNQKWAQTSLMGSIMFLPLTATYLRQWAAIPIIGTRRAVMPEQTFLPLIFIASIVLLSVTGNELTAPTTAILYAGIMVTVLAGSFLSQPLRNVYVSAWRNRGDVTQQTVRQQMRDGLPFVWVAIGSVLSQACMPLVIAATCGFVESGYFALAMPFAALAAVPLGPFNLSMIPRCARHFKNGEFAEANHAVRRAATATFLLAVLISFVTWQFSPLLVILLGKEYSTVCGLFPPLLLAAIVDCLTGPTIPVMQTMKMEMSYTRALFVFIPMQLGLIFLFGQVAGIEGAAMAYLLARILWNVVVVIRIYQVRGLVMLPYLRITRAMQEWSPMADKDVRLQPAAQKSWKTSADQFPVEAVRAA